MKTSATEATTQAQTPAPGGSRNHLHTNRSNIRQNGHRSALARAEPDMGKTTQEAMLQRGKATLQIRRSIEQRKHHHRSKLEFHQCQSRQRCVSTRHGPRDRIGEWNTRKCHSGSAFQTNSNTSEMNQCACTKKHSGLPKPANIPWGILTSLEPKWLRGVVVVVVVF